MSLSRVIPTVFAMALLLTVATSLCACEEPTSHDGGPGPSDSGAATAADTNADTGAGARATDGHNAGNTTDVNADASDPDAAAAARGPRPIPPPSIVPAVPKIVAIGDVHGDIVATRKVLQLAGAIDKNDTWIGGKLVVVQVGDQLDRGDGEKAILLLLEDVADQAHKAGGALYVLNGNHETMNVARSFGYVTPGGWKDFGDVPHVPNDSLLAKYATPKRGRVSAFRPAGPYANLLAGHNTIQVVGENVFVHGGVLPKHVTYGIAKINAEISAWMRNKGPKPASVTAADCPVWSRHYSKDVDASDCALAAKMLKMLGAKRIIVAHTVQSKGINSVCNGAVWRVDVGLSKHYGGKAQVLFIEGSDVHL